MYQKKKDHYPTAVLAITSLLCGIASIVLLILVPIEWLDFVIYTYLFFAIVAVLLGGYSLLIKRNTRAWVAVIAGLIFIILFLITAYLMSTICIIC
ncbi:hypothetical protein [Sphingobacterium arenae]|uniref:DUF4190 domain-containing protein n=1 Tax=Sphingobacterium arenae TaxID=1280598 RepID=A0ABR7Y165_9SPHI|nr:hypothetical protein [Sphingobacterium arenae]MBD1425045.1 hypothetical protein [Sphingobacterium arenae]